MAYTYMYNNKGEKIKYHAKEPPALFSGPYRAFVTESSKNSSSSKSAKSGTGSRAAAGAADIEANAAYEAQKAEERRRQEKIDAINANKAAEKNALYNNLKLQRKQAEMKNGDNLRQLYVAYMQGLMGMPQQQAVWGAGGEIESLKNRSRLNYESNRAKENQSYAGILADIQTKYNNDLMELERRYLQQLLNV